MLTRATHRATAAVRRGLRVLVPICAIGAYVLTVAAPWKW